MSNQIRGLGIYKVAMFLALFLCLSLSSFGQNNFTGSIVQADDKAPVPYATVYLNNTTFGVAADENGHFELDIPDGSYEVLVRLLGYETLTFTINTESLAKQGYRIELVSDEQELDLIEVEEERPESWYKNLKTFKSNFLGYSSNAKQTEIINEKILIMDNESSPGQLIVKARDALDIYNPNLGYRISYILSQFVLSPKEGKIVYAGNSLFQSDTTLKKSQLKRIERNRDLAYYGSIQHLMQSLYYGKALEEGYIFKEIRRIPNPDRASDEAIAEARKEYTETADPDKKDSLRMFFMSEVDKPKIIRQLIDVEMNPSEFVRTDENGKVFLQINDLIQVIYTKEKEERNYVGSANTSRIGFQKSIIDQLNPEFEIYSNGNYSDTYGLMFEGYMAWEKVADLMPLDYLPADIPWR